MKLVIQRSRGPAGGCIGVLIFLWSIYSFIFNTYANSLILYSAILLSCLYLIFKTKYGLLHLKKFATYKGVIAMVILLLISSMFVNTTHFMACLQQTIFFFLSLLFGYLVFSAASEHQFYVFWDRIQWVLVIVAIFGIIEWVTGVNFFIPYFKSEGYTGTGTTGRIASCFIHPIPFGHIMLYAFCLCLYLPSLKVTKFLLMFLFAFSVLATGSRSSWICLAFVLAIYVVLNTKRTVKIRTLISIVAAFIVLIVFLYSDSGAELIAWMSSRLGSQSATFSNEVRTRVYLYFFSIFFSSDFGSLLFGHGFNALAELVETSVFQSMAVDNTLLTILYDYGLIAGILALVLIVHWIKYLFTSRNENKDMQLILTLLSVNVLMSMFYDSFGWKNVSFLSFTIIGCWMSLEQKRLKNADNREK